MHTLQLSQIARLLFALFHFKLLSPSTASGSLNPTSLSVAQEFTSEQLLSTDFTESVAIPQISTNEDVDIQAKIEHFISQTGSVKKAFIEAARKGFKEAVFHLLENEQIEIDDVNQAMEKASSKGHKEIVVHLYKDKRINASTISESIHSAAKKGRAEIVLLLLNDQRIQAEDIKEAWRRAITKGHKDIVSCLLKDARIDSTFVKKVFLVACEGGQLEIARLFLKDGRIEPKDVNDALLELCKTESFAFIKNSKARAKVFSALLDDSRIDAANVNKALVEASKNGNEDIVFRLLDDYRIDWDSVNNALLAAFGTKVNKNIVFRLLDDKRIVPFSVNYALVACLQGNTEIFLRLVSDKRIETSLLKGTFKSVSMFGPKEVVFHLLNDDRIEADAIKHGLESAIVEDQKDVVFRLLEDNRIDAADVRKGFQTACSKYRIGIVIHLLKDERIEADDVRSAFKKLCVDGHLEAIRALIKDDRLGAADLNEGYKHLPSGASEYQIEPFIEDQRLDPVLVKECFLKACTLNRGLILEHLIKDERLDSDSVNRGFLAFDSDQGHVALPSTYLGMKILFLEDDRLESKYARKILEEIFAKGQVEILSKQSGLNSFTIDLIKEESAKLIKRFPPSPSKLVPLLQKKLLETFDLDFVTIRKVARKPDILLLYVDGLQNKLSQIMENIGGNPDMVTKEVTHVPKWSLHAFNAVQMLVGNENIAGSYSSLIVALMKKMVQLYHILGSLSNLTYIARARTSLLFVPHSLCSSLKRITGESEVEELAQSSIQKYLHQTYFPNFQEFLNDEFEGNKPDFLRKYLQLYLGPDMSCEELKLAQTMIGEDLGRSAHPKSFEYDIFNVYNYTDCVVKDWILSAWKSGERGLFDFVVVTLTDHWGSKEWVVELINQIGHRQKNLTDLQLYFIDTDVEKVLEILTKQPNNFGSKELFIENFTFEQIQELPLNENTFFGPSFSLLSNPEELGLESANFQISYFNEKGGADQGGPSRNWSEKMLHAMADPRRHFLKIHGVKNQLVPDIGVDPKVFFALGRLIGKAISVDAGLPFAFHPKWILIMKEPQNTELIAECFNEFYKEELGLIESLLTYIEGNSFDDIWDRNFASPCEWRSTSEAGFRNFMTLSKPVENGAFHPTKVKEIEDFVSLSKKRAFSEFKTGISSFMKGLDLHIKADLIRWVKTPILVSIFSPSPEINVDSLLFAFNLDSGEGIHVEISKEDLDNIDGNVSVMSSVDPDGPSRISVEDAFVIAIKKLSLMNLLPGLVGQITGSRSVGFRNLQPRMFKVKFYELVGSRPLFGEESASGHNVQLPTASSCNLSLTIPVYRTLKEMCFALELLARAADDFVFQ